MEKHISIKKQKQKQTEIQENTNADTKQIQMLIQKHKSMKTSVNTCTNANTNKYKLQQVFCTNWTFAGNTMITGKIACRDHLTVGTEKLRNG